MSEALGAAVVETHSAVIFLFGDRAYKVQKAVSNTTNSRSGG